MIKFALVGAGRIAQKYSDIFHGHQVADATCVAVCDIDKAKAQKIGERLGVNYYTDYHDMARQNPQIDCFIVLSESGNHAKHVLELTQYKKHIIVEKPMALTLSDADAMIRACDLAGVKLFVVKQNRFNLPVQKMREAFDAGAFGKIVMGTVRVRWCRRQDYYDQASWRGTWAMDGGVFSNQASHHVDLLTWFLGEPVSVFAKSRTALVNIEAEDTGVAIITFKSGAIGVVEATTAVRPVDLEGSLSLIGEKAMVEIGGFAVNKLKTWNFTDEKYSKVNLDEFSENPSSVYGFGHVRYIHEVCQAIQLGRASLVDGLEGRKSLELINAIYESIETGREVMLKFQPKQCKLGII